MQIGTLKLDVPLLLAPMAGITGQRQGAAL